MKSKTQALIVYFCFMFSLTILVLVLAFVVHPEKESVEGKVFINSLGYGRYEKTRYISKNHSKYNAYILGGSKASVLNPEILNEKTGFSFYNYYVSFGCFADYERYVKYVASLDEVKEILLHLSSSEIEYFQKGKYVPTKIKFSFGALIKEMKNKIDIYTDIKKALDNSPKLCTEENGYVGFGLARFEMLKEPETFIEKYLYTYWGDYQENLHSFFYDERTLPAFKENLQSLKRIQDFCDQKNIALKVVIGPTFLGELHKYKSEEYADYLRKMVSITDVWNFGGINPFNLNACNFMNGGHYFKEVGDKMLETIYSKDAANISDMDAFGILLTSENIENFLQDQKEKFLLLKDEYERTGAIKLSGVEDETFIR